MEPEALHVPQETWEVARFEVLNLSEEGKRFKSADIILTRADVLPEQTGEISARVTHSNLATSTTPHFIFANRTLPFLFYFLDHQACRISVA